MPTDPFDTYRTHEWFESLAWQHRWIEFIVGWWCGTYGVPKTMIDYGSGDGWWSHSFKAIGSEHCFAVELDAVAADHIALASGTTPHGPVATDGIVLGTASDSEPILREMLDL